MTPAQTFHDHIKELRRRILWVVLAIGVSAGVSYALRLPIIKILQRPLDSALVYSSPAGSFDFVLKLSMVTGMFVALPVMIYHLIRFIEPALPIEIKRSMIIKIIGSSFVLAIAGIAFGFFLMIPMSLHFFNGFATPEIKPLITAGEYLTFVINHMMTFAIVFQIPLVVMFINWIKPMRPSQLLRYQKFVIVGSLGLAVVLPFTYDPLSQFIVAIPIVVLFYLSAVLLWIVNRGKTYPVDNSKRVSYVPPLKPASDLVRMLNNEPKPLPSSPKVVLALSGHRSFAMDGFVSRPTNILPVSAKANYVNDHRGQVSEPKLEQIAARQPRLAIDGISPPLPSYF